MEPKNSDLFTYSLAMYVIGMALVASAHELETLFAQLVPSLSVSVGKAGPTEPGAKMSNGRCGPSSPSGNVARLVDGSARYHCASAREDGSL